MFSFGRSKIDDQTNTAAASSASGTSPAPGAADRSAPHLRALGLTAGASWDEISRAHARLVSDLTPGPGASHRNVALAEELLEEVNHALASLRMQSVA